MAVQRMEQRPIDSGVDAYSAALRAGAFIFGTTVAGVVLGLAGLWFASDRMFLFGMSLAFAGLIVHAIFLARPEARAWRRVQPLRKLVASDPAAAAAKLEAVTQQYPEFEEAHLLAGMARFRLGDASAAANHLGKVRFEKLRPDAGRRSVRGMYAFALLALGRQDDAITVLQPLRGKDAQDVTVTTVLGMAFADKGDHETALRVLERVPFPASIFTEQEALRSYVYGASLQALGRRDEAFSAYRAVMAFDVNFMKVRERVKELASMASAEPQQPDDQALAAQPPTPGGGTGDHSPAGPEGAGSH